MESKEKASLIKYHSDLLNTQVVGYLMKHELDAVDSMSVVMNCFISMKLKFLQHLKRTGMQDKNITKAYLDLSFMVQQAIQRESEAIPDIKNALSFENLAQAAEVEAGNADTHDLVTNTMKDLF